MKRNIRLTIEYDGSRYQGWQRLGGDSNASDATQASPMPTATVAAETPQPTTIPT